MDYLIDLNTLKNKESEINTLKISAEDIYNECNSNYFSQLSSTEISSLCSSIKDLASHLKNGCQNSNTWYINYNKELNLLEDNLTNFTAASLDKPLEFTAKFEDLFSRKAMPILKTGANIHMNAVDRSPFTGDTTVSNTEGTLFTVQVPGDLKQSGYTITGYDYWADSGAPMVWSASTNQRRVSDIWKQQGSRFKNGIAVVNVNGQDRYLIAVSQVFGKVGDSVSVRLKNGQTVPCIIADAKSSHDYNYTRYGHATRNGAINVLEFEVERAKYLASGNPKTSTWGLEWDSTSGVATVDNHGSIL